MADTWITNHHRGRRSALVASTNDHVDAINRAVQQARLDAGHLDPDVTTRIAGGEHAHVGDVVATRRNDRRLITTAGEPVRNRDTWTVTAIGDDGSLTVSAPRRTRRRDPARRLHPRACPARLRGDRARLGVRQRHRRHLPGLVGDDASRLLRRGHPRRRGERDLRDHRQRRHRRSPRHPRRHRRRRPCRHPRRHPTPQPRPPTPRPSTRAARPAGSTMRHPGLVPDAPSRRTQRPRRRRATSRDAGSATSTAARRHRRRRQRPRCRRGGDRTRPRRPRERRRPRRRRPSDTSPPRNAVSTRRRVEPVAVSETNSTSPNAGWSVPTPTSNGPGSGPNRPSSSTARRRPTDAPPATTCATATPPICSTPCTTPSRTSRQRVAALDTWQRWAKGHHVGTNDLRAAVDTLNTVDGSERPFAEALAGSLQQWAIHNHVDLTAAARPAPAIQPVGIEIDL